MIKLFYPHDNKKIEFHGSIISMHHGFMHVLLNRVPNLLCEGDFRSIVKVLDTTLNEKLHDVEFYKLMGMWNTQGLLIDQHIVVFKYRVENDN